MSPNGQNTVKPIKRPVILKSVSVVFGTFHYSPWLYFTMSPVNVSFMPLEGSFPSGLFWPKLCCGKFSFPRVHGWASTLRSSGQDSAMLLGGDPQQVQEETWMWEFASGLGGWSLILALSLHSYFMEAPSPAPSFFHQTDTGMTVEKTMIETHSLVVPQAEIRRGLFRELWCHPIKWFNKSQTAFLIC